MVHRAASTSGAAAGIDRGVDIKKLLAVARKVGRMHGREVAILM
jgi:hypothetical protein